MFDDYKQQLKYDNQKMEQITDLLIEYVLQSKTGELEFELVDKISAHTGIAIMDLYELPQILDYRGQSFIDSVDGKFRLGHYVALHELKELLDF